MLAVPSALQAHELPGFPFTGTGIRDRVSAFRRDLGVLSRDGKNDTWSFVSVEKIKLSLNLNAEKYGLFFEVGSADDVEAIHQCKDGVTFYATALVHLRAVCIDDDTQATAWVSHLGFAIQEHPRDTNITNCAQTQAIKYGLHKLLLLVSGEIEPDRVSVRPPTPTPTPAPALRVVPKAQGQQTAYRSLRDVCAYLQKQGVPTEAALAVLAHLGLQAIEQNGEAVVGFAPDQQRAFTRTTIRAAYERLSASAAPTDDFDALLSPNSSSSSSPGSSSSSSSSANKNDRAYANSLHVLHLLLVLCPQGDPAVQAIRAHLQSNVVIDRPTLVAYYNTLSRLSAAQTGVER